MRLCDRVVAIVLVACLLLPGSRTAEALRLSPALSQSPVAQAVRVRVGVTADGIVRITPAKLASLGLEVASVDPRTFALSSLGQPVAIYVSGEADGHFDAASGDELLFFGQRFRGSEMDQKYTDERVYWLDIGGTAGPRMATLDAAPQGNLTPPSDFLATVHAEQNSLRWTLDSLNLDTQDTWFWDRLRPLGPGQGVTGSFPYTVPDPASGFAATLRLEEISRADVPGHITTIDLNGTRLGDANWDGKVRRTITMAVPSGLLTSGSNTVVIGAYNEAKRLWLPLIANAAGIDASSLTARTQAKTPITPPQPQRSYDVSPLDELSLSLQSPQGLTVDDIYVNYWEADYRRLFRAWQGQLDFTTEAAGPREYLIHNWASSQVAVWDVSNPLLPVRLTGATSAAGSFDLRFRSAASQGTRFWLQELATAQAPVSLLLRPDTGLRSPTGGADAVIVTSALLRPAAEQLATWHRNHGRRALVADFQDVVDEFNDGIYHPKAVPAMLAWARTHWTAPAPQFLTLVGDGHWNFKGYSPTLYPPAPIMIPPYLAFVDPWLGEAPADTLFGDLDGDGVPEIAVGRLSVNTLAEALTVVGKIVSYDESVRVQPWQKRAIFVADRTDPYVGNFAADADDIIQNNTPSDLTPTRIYLGTTVSDGVSAKAALAGAINAGAFMLQYGGHGAPYLWSSERIWQTSAVTLLTNQTQLPVVMSFNCRDGDFAQPNDPQSPNNMLDSIAETMQRYAAGGSVAAISPTGLGLVPHQTAFRKVLLDVMFKDNVREIGAALTIAKQRYSAQPDAAQYLIATQMLYGDPAMQLPSAGP